MAMYNNSLIFGKDASPNIVNVSIDDTAMHIYTEENGIVSEEIRPANFWIVSKLPNRFSTRLKGNNYYNHIKMFSSRQDFLKDRGAMRNQEVWSVYDEQEQNLIFSGLTYFKGMKVSDVSVLSFDIESTGVQHNEESKVLMISNTLRVGTEVYRKLFKYDDYETVGNMIYDWCKWVRDVNPSILTGHNIFGFDLPYMSFCYKQEYDEDMLLGRDDSPIKYNSYTSSFRKDGSQAYDYFNAKIVGREIIDTFFLSIKYDFARKYISYGLKSIIKQEGLEKKGRQHYDASQIGKNYKIPREWKKIIQYGKEDADDALALFDLMIPAYFYFAQSVPKTLQQIINGATGSQLNSVMVRSYLQEGKSIAKASDIIHFEGAISFGNPGVYKNCYKVDFSALYPSIIRHYRVHDKTKDPDGNYLKMVEYYTDQRLVNKSLAKKTGDRHYKDLEQSQKIGANSAYGLLGAPGLNYNSPLYAARITMIGRELLKRAIKWATGEDYVAQ